MNDKTFLGKYRIPAEEISAAGELSGSSLAYQAEEIDSGKKVVVELVPIGSLKMAAVERLEAKAMTAKKLNHVNIAALYDFGVEDDHLVYVTEDLEGTLADEWVNAHGPMPVGPVLRVALQVVSALGAAAVYHIVHPAINPRNLLLVPGQTAEGEWPLVKLLHFVGVAPKLSGTDVAVAAFDKSLHYLSPEQLKKRGKIGFSSEIYSLGCTMWFLLTGAPPLVAPKGRLTVKPATAEGKGSDIPKKVRRLLAEMLSANPETRLRDPIEFYRKLQECLVQVERRERMSWRFGVPSSFRVPSAGLPFFRRTPMRALVVAAVLLAIATLAAFVVPGYIRHRRILRAQEPLGVPIGVPDAVALATPAAANTTSPMASNPPEESAALVQSNSPPAGPVAAVSDRRPVSLLAVDGQRPPLQENQEQAKEGAEATNAKALPPATSSTEVVETKQVDWASESPAPDLPPSPREQEAAPVMASNADKPSADDGPSEATTADAAATAPSPAHSRHTVARKTAPKKIVLHEVRRAEPAELEVRRAEAAPPGEGLVPPAPDSDSRVTAQPRVRTKRPPKSKRQMNERIYLPEPMPEFAGPKPRSPRRSVRGRVVGVTPDGQLMLQLPSNEIVIVPPPPPRER